MLPPQQMVFQNVPQSPYENLLSITGEVMILDMTFSGKFTSLIGGESLGIDLTLSRGHEANVIFTTTDLKVIKRQLF
jgi:hypothetical protein